MSTQSTPSGGSSPVSPGLQSWGPLMSNFLLLPLRAATLAAIAVVLFLLNAFVEGPHVSRYAELVLVYMGINIILAVSLNIVNGFTGQFSLGHIGFYAVGAYVGAAMADYGHTR